MSSNKYPRISVLLPVYNAEKYITETLDSLLRQTFVDFEIIAINDGSTDKSLSILKKYADRDDRIIVFDQKNKGLVFTLNRAAELATGEFLARIDADDIALPHRFELQVNEFSKNDKAVMVAGGFDVIDTNGEILYHDAVPTKYADLLTAFYTRNPIAHGSIMMKTSAFKKSGGYSSNCGPTEDYELWTRLVHLGQIVVIANTIFRWRVNPNGITQSRAKEVEKNMNANLDRYWNEHPYHIIKRAKLTRRLDEYVRESRYGISIKHVVLNDICEVSIHLAKRGHYLKAIYQFFIVFSTGRTGIRIGLNRIKRPVVFHLRSFFRKKS